MVGQRSGQANGSDLSFVIADFANAAASADLASKVLRNVRTTSRRAVLVIMANSLQLTGCIWPLSCSQLLFWAASGCFVNASQVRSIKLGKLVANETDMEMQMEIGERERE